MCCESVPLDTSTKVRFMVEQALFRAARHKGLYWGHIQLGRPPSCVGGDTFMTMYPELFRDDKWGKNSHNSLLDINDLWHLRWKSPQFHSAADLQGGILAGWVMPNMKGTKLQFKMPLKFPVCNIFELEAWPKNTVSLCAHQFRSRVIVPTHRSIPLTPCRGQYLEENDCLWKLLLEMLLGAQSENHRDGPASARRRRWHSSSSNYEWHQTNT